VPVLTSLQHVDQLRDINLPNGVAVLNQGSVAVYQVKGDTLTLAHDFKAVS
jgi:hypothetical protein